MKGFIIKDFINLKKNFRIFALMILVYGFLAYTMESASYFGSMFTLIFALLFMNTYSFDEYAKWDVYALTLPVTRKDILRAKYITMLSLALAGYAVSSIMVIVLNIILRENNVLKGLGICSLGAAAAILFYSIGIPIITKLGIEKARYILLATYVIPFLIGYMGYKALRKRYTVPPQNLVRIGEFLVKYAIVIIPLVLIIALAVSYAISVNIYRKKEF